MTTSSKQQPSQGQPTPAGVLAFRTSEFAPPNFSVVIRCEPRWKPVLTGQYRDGAWLFNVSQSPHGAGLILRLIVLDIAGHVQMLSDRLRVPPDDGVLFAEGEVRFRRMSRALRAVGAGMDQHRTTAAWTWGVAALILVLAAARFSVQGFQQMSLLHLALALILLGLAAALLYEADALRQPRADPADPDPTIGRVAGLAFLQHPWAWLVVLVGVMALAGALIIHFTSSNGVLFSVLGFSIVAYVAGGLAVATVAARFKLWF